MNNNMDKEVVWRVANMLGVYLDEHASISKAHPYNYDELRGLVSNINEFVEFLNGYEQNFLDWATKSINEDNYYRYNTDHYGIRVGKSNPECYPNVSKLLSMMVSNKEVFNYIYDEYLIMEEAKNSNNARYDRESRTCAQCETRFDTYQGMHRHQSRCKGDAKLTFVEKMKHEAYRGDYHAKDIPTTTSVW
jgi:hypothetical protein